MDVLELRKEGWFCPAGDFFIDPKTPVDRAILTHAHSDHARPGMNSYLCHRQSRSVLKLRLGKNIVIQTLEYGEKLSVGGARISFHPAGHIPGSAMVRIEVKGNIWVVSGDYKTHPDGLSTPFEPVRCNTFITESTFGLPIFQWSDISIVVQEILTWARLCHQNEKIPALQGYSLGKLQRLLFLLHGRLPIFMHPALEQTNEALMADGLCLPLGMPLRNLNEVKKEKGILLTPVTPPHEKRNPIETAFCSGWMAVRRLQSKGQPTQGFVISDHADWNGLLNAVIASEASKVYCEHGYAQTLSRFIGLKGIDATTSQNIIKPQKKFES
jgi:putative mRNA 3-end processing factor